MEIRSADAAALSRTFIQFSPSYIQHLYYSIITSVRREASAVSIFC
jgi:hypothetical protein